MAKVNLSGMDVASLMELRTKIDDALSGQRSILEKQLQALNGSIGSLGRARKSLKGKKVASTAVRKVRPGPDAALHLDGLLKLSRVERSARIF